MAAEKDSGTVSAEQTPRTTKRRPRTPPGTPGPGYRRDSNEFLRKLVDAEATIKVALQGQPNGVIEGCIVGFDAWHIWLLKDGREFLLFKGACRYLVQVE